MGGIGGVERPGELGPSPPDEPEHEHHFADRAPRNAVVEQAHDLRDAEDEHEVEKELDERDFLACWGGYFLRHLQERSGQERSGLVRRTRKARMQRITTDTTLVKTWTHCLRPLNYKTHWMSPGFHQCRNRR